MDTELDVLKLDRESRNKIVSDMETNYFVEAGAGSGKTTMLVNRMVAMVESGIDISRICAITFTKAAANEFRGRFQKVLLERSTPSYVYEDKGYAGQLPAPTEETRERCAYALQNLDFCFMGTIDSFCQMIISEHPYEAGVPSDAAVVSDEELQVIYKQEYIRICNGAYGDACMQQAARFAAFYKNPEDVFVQGMRLFMDYKNTEIIYTQNKDYIPGSLDQTYQEYKKTVTEEFKQVWAFRGLWEKKLSVVLGELNAKEYTKGAYKNLQDLQYDVSMTFFMQAAEKVQAYLRANGYMTYFDYLYYLREMLKKDAQADGAMIRYISKRHSYFLIDEFQDTAPIQSEIFFYLTAQTPVPEWRDCKPKPGTLFIVGDPKQSIYRFRNADVGSYLSVKRLFETMANGEILYLARNFRSRKVLSSYYNSVFSKTLVPSENQSAYTQIPVVEDQTEEFEGVFTYDCYTGKLMGENPAYEDKQRVSEIIRQLVGNPNLNLRDADGHTMRTIRYSDIMVISKVKTRMKDLITEFTERHIPVRVEGKILFKDCEALNVIFAIYNALLGRDISPEDGKHVLNQGDNRRVFDDLKTQLAACSPAALFYQIMEKFRIYQYVSADTMEIPYYVLELLRNEESKGAIVSLEDGADYIAGLLREDADQERCLSLDDRADCVYLANLHKVKGLEAPIVILAYAWDAQFRADKRVEYAADGVKTYLFRLRGENPSPWNSYEREVLCSTERYRAQETKEIEALDAEEKRLVYVAATRARNALIVSRVVHYVKGGELTVSGAWRDLWEGTPDFFAYLSHKGCVNMPVAYCPEEVSAKESYKAAEQECVLINRGCETESYEIVTPSRLELDTSDAEAALGNRTDRVEDPENEITEAERSFLLTCANVLGTMLHRLMELLVISKNQLSIEDMTAQILEECIPAEYEAQTDIFAHAVSVTAARVRNGGYKQKNGLPQDILQTLLAADEVYTEVPFCYSEKQGTQTIVYNGIMDAVYCEQGTWHIIDYKTNYDGEHLDKKYKAQLDAYIRALKQTTGQEADAKIYHIKL